MNLTALLSKVRTTLDDSAGSSSEYLWSDAEITGYLNEAVDQMCRVIPTLIRDSSTTAVCSLSLVAGTMSYTLDSSVLDVTRIKISGYGVPLQKVTTDWLDTRKIDWDNTTNRALPTYYVLDYIPGKVSFCYTPDQAYTATLTVHRVPLATEQLTTSTPSGAPVIAAQYHHDLIYWTLHRCYEKNDMEAFNKDASKKYYEIFQKSLSQIYTMEFRKRGDINVYPLQGML